MMSTNKRIRNDGVRKSLFGKQHNNSYFRQEPSIVVKVVDESLMSNRRSIEYQSIWFLV